MTEMQKRDLQMKMEIASELGLMDKVEKVGWKGLSAKETGRIGGIMGRKKIKEREKKKSLQETSCNPTGE